MGKKGMALAWVCSLLMLLGSCSGGGATESKPLGSVISARENLSSTDSSGAEESHPAESNAVSSQAGNEDSQAEQGGSAQIPDSDVSAVSSQMAGSNPSHTAPSTSSKARPASSSGAAQEPKPDPGFSWDPGGNYAGDINVQTTQLSGEQVTGGGAVIDIGNSAQGYVMVKRGAQMKTKIRVIGPSGKTYQRYILSDDEFHAIPLQMGDGQYTVSVWQNTSGNKYVKLTEASFVGGGSANYTRLPNIYSEYTASSSAVRKGFGLCMNAENDLDKVRSIYNYIIESISYDYDKAASVATDYIAKPDATLASKNGICFDYASLMAAMLRTQGIPAKIVFGEVGGQSHAWNDVYIESLGWIAVGIPSNGGWKRLDSTYGVSMSAEKLENDSQYSAMEYY